MTYDILTPSLATLWPYKPTGPYAITRSFQTDIITSRNGTEQRRALRFTPRLSARYQTFIRNDQMSLAENRLKALQNAPAVIADHGRYVAMAAASAGATAITITTPPAWIAEGQIIVLGCSDAVVVSGVSGSTVSLDAPLGDAWADGTIVRPGLFGLLDGQLRTDRIKPTAATLSVSLQVYPGAEPPEDEGTATTFNGLEVFTFDPDWRASPSLEYIYPVEQVDYGFGRTAQFRPIDRSQTLYEAEFAGLSPASAQAIEQVFLRAKGRRGEFYHSTCRPDMALAADASGTSFTVRGTDIASLFGSVDYSQVSQAIEIVQRNGTRVRRLVTDISAGSGVSTITVDSSVSLTTAGTARISWMPVVRFASDDLMTEWVTPRIARIRAAFQSVRT